MFMPAVGERIEMSLFLLYQPNYMFFLGDAVRMWWVYFGLRLFSYHI